MKAIGYERITVTQTPAGLNVPEGALTCIMGFVANPASTSGEVCARFSETFEPTATEGMPLGNFGTYECVGGNMETFLVVSVNASAHELNIQYYG